MHQLIAEWWWVIDLGRQALALVLIVNALYMLLLSTQEAALQRQLARLSVVAAAFAAICIILTILVGMGWLQSMSRYHYHVGGRAWWYWSDALAMALPTILFVPALRERSFWVFMAVLPTVLLAIAGRW